MTIGGTQCYRLQRSALLTYGTGWPLPPFHTPTIEAARSVDTCGPMLAGEVHTLISVYKRFPFMHCHHINMFFQNHNYMYL